MIVYETRNHWFIMDDGRKVELTNREHDFFIAISSGHLTTYDEIANHIFGYQSKKNMINVKNLKHKIEQKTNIRIEAKDGYGLILKTEISFI